MQNLFQIMQQLQQLKQLIDSSGKSPEDFYNSVINSGKYSQSQIDQAKEMAEMLSKILKGGRK